MESNESVAMTYSTQKHMQKTTPTQKKLLRRALDEICFQIIPQSLYETLNIKRLQTNKLHEQLNKAQTKDSLSSLNHDAHPISTYIVNS